MKAGLAMMVSGRAMIDPHFANVVSLLNFGGPAGSTTFTDAKGKIWTAYGDAKIDTEYGPAVLLDGAGDYISTPASTDFDMSNGLFTIEGFFRETSQAVIRQVIGAHTTASGGESSSAFLLLSDNGVLKFQIFMGSSYYTVAAPSAHTTGAIHHYAAERDVDDVFRLKIDGVQVAALTQSGYVNNAARPLTIGAVMGDEGPNSGGYYFNGRVMPTRITRGVCRYPGSETFTPPPFGPFPTS